jgi:hypothetical protein
MCAGGISVINRLVREIEYALAHNLYMVALTTTLMLPDVCGKAAYPNLRVGERYKRWYDENIGQYEKPNDIGEGEEIKLPVLDGEMVYRLRCAFLHEGNPDAAVNNKNLDRFEIIVETEKPFHIYTGEMGSVHSDDTGWSCKTYKVNVRRICRIVCAVAKNYYLENCEKFTFFSYTIIDMDKEKEQLRQLGFMQEIDMNDACRLIGESS